MTSQASRRLSSLSAEIESARARLARLQDRLEIQRAGLDESRMKMLIAETPLADRELQAAAAVYLGLECEVRQVEEALTGLERDQLHLSSQLTSAGA